MEILREEMEKHDAKVLKSVHLQIGQLSAIVPEALSFCFQVMVEGTEMEGAKLVMDIIPLRGRCPECRKEFERLVSFAQSAQVTWRTRPWLSP